MSWDSGEEYETAAMIRARIQRQIEERRENGEPFVPTSCDVARGLPAKTFWGKAWCTNLESYSDFESRLPRGRTYLRKGCVYDLVLEEGVVTAYVTGKEIYSVLLRIDGLDEERWDALKHAIAGEVGNLVDLLSGQLGAGVMEAVTDPESGLFPAPAEIQLSCSCPDWADCCKHVAAVLYAIGVQLDASPELFFRLRQVDHTELIEAAATESPSLCSDDASAQVLAPDELAELFGIDLADPESAFG